MLSVRKCVFILYLNSKSADQPTHTHTCIVSIDFETGKEDPDQTVRSRRLTWAFVASICDKTRFGVLYFRLQQNTALVATVFVINSAENVIFAYSSACIQHVYILLSVNHSGKELSQPQFCLILFCENIIV